LNGDGRSDLAVFDRRLGRFLLEDGTTFSWGRPGDIPAIADYDGDRRMELAVFRPSTGVWYIPGRAPVLLGGPGDIPIPMDDRSFSPANPGRAQPTVFWLPESDRHAYWKNVDAGAYGIAGYRGDIVLTPYEVDGATGTGDVRTTGTWRPWLAVFEWDSHQFGMPGDIPVPGNFIGDTNKDSAVFRPSTGTWFIREALGAFGSPDLRVHWGAPGDIPVLLDRDGDARLEVGVFRPSTAVWYFLNLTTGATETVQLGRPGDVPLGAPAAWWMAHTKGDADGDRRADPAVFRPSTNEWWLTRSSGLLGIPGCDNGAWVCTPDPSFPKTTRVSWGMTGDVPAGGDYDGDGRLDPTVFRPSDGTWNILSSASEYTAPRTVSWGLAGDTPVPADYDADGRIDVAVFRPSTGRWYLRLSADDSRLAIDWGQPGDVPVAADYDGDGRADLAVFRPSAGRFYILNRFEGTYEVREWGLAGDTPVVADYDGDGFADAAVFRPVEGRWYVRLSSTQETVIREWGVNGDVPQPADYDGDGRADVAVFRPSTGRWYVPGVIERDWGMPGDIPVVKQP
jgi:hypothetical protein